MKSYISNAKPTKRLPERVAIEELIDDSLLLVRPVLKKSAIDLKQQIESELYITADRDQIKQVLINILLNSLEAMEEKLSSHETDQQLTLSVWAREQSSKIIISIRDEGIGMTTEELSICCDPFFSTKDAGTGLGLALCQQYVNENNGIMEIESKKNKYTIISLIFERS